MASRRPWLVSVLAVLSSLPVYGRQPASSARSSDPGPTSVRATLIEGVTTIAAPGQPGPLVVFGPDAFVVAVGDAGPRGVKAPVVAAARLGKGRVVAFGHTGYLDAGTFAVGDTGRLVANAIRWSSGKDPGGRSIRVGAVGYSGLAALLQAQGFDATDLPGDWIGHINEWDAICLGQHPLTESDEKAIRKYVESGHGLLMAGLGWGWLQLNPGRSIVDHPGNHLLAPAGIIWADGTVQRTSAEGYAVDHDVAIPPNCHAGHALATLAALADADRKTDTQPVDDALTQAGWTATLAVRNLPPDDQLLLPQCRRLLAAHTAALVPSKAHPITAKQPLERFLLAFQFARDAKLPPAQVSPHPAAAEFPGSVPSDAARVTRTISIDRSVPGWHSTGLYAAPGEVIKVEAGSKNTEGLRVRIGAHTDELWGLDRWQRVPEISREFPIAKQRCEMASPFGGLIYIETPARRRGSTQGEVSMTIAGAVEAPRFVLGKTSNDEWKTGIRARPAPWAELETRKIILTVPSRVIRQLDDPESLMSFWDRVLDAHARLAAMPLERERPERIVADVQISAGYMHSGYPIMTHLDAAEHMVNLADLEQGKNLWGLVHELGHNHQNGDWTFAGAGEVTCNLFSLHALETVCHLPPGQRGHPAVDRPPSVADYVAHGSSFQQWQKEPFLALQTYIQLKDAFGWSAFEKVFAEYRALPADQRPRNDDAKRDQWLTRFSRVCGRNLAPFFTAWGIPTSAAAREAVSDLPEWMPEGWPGR